MKITSWRDVPLLLFGYDIRRWEEPGGGEYYFYTHRKCFSFLEHHKGYGPTHLQYHSPWGFLLTWPLCFHFWFQIRPQKFGVPGSEKVLYFRIGFARWDAGDSCYMLPTLYLGLHWD